MISVMSTRIEVSRGDGGRLRCDLRAGALAPRLIHRDRHTVASRLRRHDALLLAGDDVVIDVHVAQALALEIIETGGTVAYDMRGGSASWQVTATVERRLGAGLVRATPGRVRRRRGRRGTELHLAADALALLRETFVLGARRGMRGRPYVEHERPARRGPELREDLDLTVGRREDFGVLGGYRCLDTMTILGGRLEDGPGVLQLAPRAASPAQSLTNCTSRFHLGYREAAEATLQVNRPLRGLLSSRTGMIRRRSGCRFTPPAHARASGGCSCFEGSIARSVGPGQRIAAVWARQPLGSGT